LGKYSSPTAFIAGEEFFSPSAFSVHVKRLVTPAKQGDDGWRSVFVNGVVLHDLRVQYQEETGRGHSIYYSGKGSGGGSSSRKRAPQHSDGAGGHDHYDHHHQQQQHEGGAGGKGKGGGKGAKGGKGGGAVAGGKKAAAGGKRKKGKVNKELEELVRA
jgi:hypothetical protein